MSRARETPRSSLGPVRRPLRGIQIKEDTYAVIRVQTATGVEIPLINSSSSQEVNGIGRSGMTANFILQQIQELRAEKHQIVETFGSDFIFFFGDRPQFLQIQGILLNSADFDWKNEFWKNYDEYLRGTKLVENNARLYLYFDDVVVEGYMIQAASTYTSDSPYHLPFSFQLFVTNYAILSTAGSVVFQASSEHQIPAPAEGATEEARQNANSLGATGGMTSFLQAVRQNLNAVSSTVQQQRARAQALASGTYLPIFNQAQQMSSVTGQPIHAMWDEFVQGGPDQPNRSGIDEIEAARVRSEMVLRDAVEMSTVLKSQLRGLAVASTKRESESLILGRAAFAGGGQLGSFGVALLQGELADEEE